MKIYVIRHGKTKLNEENKYNGTLDEDINETGIRQAIEASEEIAKLDIDLIICSPLKRTRHTMEFINNNDIQAIYDERIIERNCGILIGEETGEFYITDYWNYYSKKEIEGAETIQELFNRVHAFLDEIIKKYKNKNILLVTHGGVARAIHFYFNELPKDGMIEKFIPDNCEIREYKI